MKAIQADLRSGTLPLAAFPSLLRFVLIGGRTYWERRSRPVYLVDER